MSIIVNGMMKKSSLQNKMEINKMENKTAGDTKNGF